MVTDYLAKAGLNVFLDKLGFNLGWIWLHNLYRKLRTFTGRNCSSNRKENIYAVSVLSGNRNFEGRISPHIKANYLASPPLSCSLCTCRSYGI